MNLSDASPGIGVVYDDGRGREDGVVTSANTTYVFVQFRGDFHSKACRPEDLTPLAIGGAS